ncbi:large proline-rich protein BAG6-like isoform X2 [Lineus longissimus]|uniref:large proline-rich protein BAG6-like isoform X2 n=1 Tax=Lineus longissimus TaxID=88925 RepID=UPI002B4F588A
MLDVTVKTLDGQNRSFSVPESTTVKQFKEKIAGSINIPEDRQRLIYQGRVLQDDKKLNDYDVHGKVIHVVQRAPPSARGASTANDTPPTMPSGGFPPRDFAIGAFAVPDPMDPSQVQSIVQQVLSGMGDVGQHARVTSRTSPDGSAVDVHINLNQSGPAMVQSESQLRINLVHRMIRLIRESLDRLENMQSGESSPQGSGTSTPSGSPPTGSRVDSETRPATEATGGATSSGTQTSSTSTETNANGQRIQAHPHTTVLSSALTELLELQERFQPWLAQYNEVLQNDPNFEGNDDELRNNQRVINQVSVILHHISHAYHSISDLIIDLSSSQPRQLRAVPAPPPPPTAVIHQTIPVQGTSNENAPNATADASATTTTSGATPTTRPMTHQGSTNPYVFMEVGPNSLSVNQISAHVFSSDRNGNSGTNTATTASASSTSTRSSTTSSASFAGGSFSLPPGAIPIRLGSIPMTGTGGRIPTGAVPVTVAAPPGAPPELMQGLVQMALQAAAQRMSGGITGVTSSPNGTVTASMGTTTSATSTTSTAGTASSAQGTNTTTTSSNAQSSTAPNAGSPTMSGFRLPALMALDSRAVDPYLPCSSRHFAMVRSTRRANGSEQSVNDVVGNLVSALIGQPNPHLQGQTGSGATAQSGNGVATSSANSSTGTTTSTSSSVPLNPFAALFTPGSQGRTTGSSASTGTANTPGMNDFASRLHQILQEGRATGPASTPPTGTSVSSGAMSDNMFAQLVSGIGSQLSTVMSGGGSGATITDFIRSMEQNYNVTQGQGLLNDLFQLIGEHMNFADLLQVFFGRPEPLQQLREPLRTFIQERIMNDQEPTEENVDAAVERAIGIVQEHIDLLCAEPGLSVEDDIDFKATLTEFIRQQMKKLIKLILRSTDNDPLFGQCLFNQCRTCIHEAIVLCRLCLRNGIDGCDQLLRSRIQYISSDISNPMIQNWMQTMSSQQLHQILPSVRISDDDIQHYIIRTSQRMESSPVLSETSEAASLMSTESAAEEVRAVESIAAAAVVEAPSCGVEMEEATSAAVEPMEAEAAGEPVTVASSSEQSTRHMNGDTITPSVINRDNLPDVVIGSQPWHRELPEDWIPVISRDVQTQRRQAPPVPLSDAYISGMPAKRRKVVQNAGAVASNEGNAAAVIPQSVKQAVAAAGVEPITNFDEIEQDAAANSTLHSVYEQQVLSDIRERLQNDPDYSSERFPQTEEYFVKDSKK